MGNNRRDAAGEEVVDHLQDALATALKPEFDEDKLPLVCPGNNLAFLKHLTDTPSKVNFCTRENLDRNALALKQLVETGNLLAQEIGIYVSINGGMYTVGRSDYALYAYRSHAARHRDAHFQG